jgi:hypothetical protein
LKVQAWWKKALDKNLWGRIIKEAKVHTGLWSQRKKKKILNCFLSHKLKHQYLNCSSCISA